MFNNVALDVVIGLVFVYLLYSLLGTIVQEIIATNFGLRAFVLKKAIVRMLDDDTSNNDDDSKALIEHFREIKSILKKRSIPEVDRKKIEENIDNLHGDAQSHLADDTRIVESKLSETFYSHPLIKYLAADTWLLKKKPSYIDPETFSKVVIDLLRGQSFQPGSSDRQPIQNSLTNGEIAWASNVPIEHETLTYLKSIWADAQGDVVKFKANLEQWFNEMMDRTTGWYKKYTQIILLGVGLIIAVAFNVDTIKIIKVLQNNPSIRDQVVAQANAFSKAHPDLESEIAKNDMKPNSTNAAKVQGLKDLRHNLYDQATKLVGSDINKTNSALAIGWNGTFWENFKAIQLSNVVGWLLTALAISLGAPFWFDLLNKLMQLKSSVAPKDNANVKSNPAVAPVKRVG